MANTADGGREGLAAADPRERACVLFDFDGTLADTKPSIVATARKVLSDWGMTDAEMGDVGRIVGPPFPGAFSLIYGLSADDAAEVTRRYRAIYNTLGPETYPLFDGMRDVLVSLSDAGRRLAVATSKRQEMVDRMLVDLGVDGLFEEVVGQTDPAHADKASLVSETLRRMDAPATDAVMVGDRSYDVEGAAANGVPCVGVLFGTAPRRELDDAGACVIVEDVDGLGRALLG